MSSEMFYNVRKYGANAIAEPSAPLKLENIEFSWIRYKPGTEAVVYYPRKGCEYDSVGIQKAIDAAFQAGGGTVFVPTGDYLIGPIRLRSRVNLHLDSGARLWASPYLEDYLYKFDDDVEFGIEKGFARNLNGLNDATQRLVTAVDSEDVSITGKGQISAQSPAWVIPWMNTNPTDWITQRPTDAFVFYRCKRISIEGIRILDTPSWTLVFDSCEHVKVKGIEIKGFDTINSDGIDLVDTSFATISDCDIHVTDDGICLKSIDPESTMSGIVVTNCIIRTLCNGLKIGTDTVGNIENVAISNIVIQNLDDDTRGAEGGINLCSVDGARVRNINISNIIMYNAECPFYLLSGSRVKQQKAYREPRPGIMEQISLSNIMAYGSSCTSFIVGHEDQPIRNVYLSNIYVKKNAGFYDHPVTEPVGKVKGYPTPYMFGSKADDRDELPAYGLYIRDVHNFKAVDFNVECIENDARSVFVEEHCSNVRMSE